MAYLISRIKRKLLAVPLLLLVIVNKREDENGN